MSRAQRNEVYGILIFCLLQYGITKWLVDIQNLGTLTGEKSVKKKVLLLKTYSSTGRVSDFWYSSVALYSRLGRPDDC